MINGSAVHFVTDCLRTPWWPVPPLQHKTYFIILSTDRLTALPSFLRLWLNNRIERFIFNPGVRKAIARQWENEAERKRWLQRPEQKPVLWPINKSNSTQEPRKLEREGFFACTAHASWCARSKLTIYDRRRDLLAWAADKTEHERGKGSFNFIHPVSSDLPAKKVSIHFLTCLNRLLTRAKATSARKKLRTWKFFVFSAGCFTFCWFHRRFLRKT